MVCEAEVGDPSVQHRLQETCSPSPCEEEEPEEAREGVVRSWTVLEGAAL